MVSPPGARPGVLQGSAPRPSALRVAGRLSPNVVSALLLSILLSSAPLAWAQSEAPPAVSRDPLQPPASARPSAPVPAPEPAPGAAGTTPPQRVVRALMAADGRRWVLASGRRLGVGDLLEGARIVRIEDNAVVVRDGDTLQRLPLHGTAVRRPAPEGATAAAPAQGPAPARHRRANGGTPAGTSVRPSADPPARPPSGTPSRAPSRSPDRGAP
jgi:hypothetical protein